MSPKHMDVTKPIAYIQCMQGWPDDEPNPNNEAYNLEYQRILKKKQKSRIIIVPPQSYSD